MNDIRLREVEEALRFVAFGIKRLRELYEAPPDEAGSVAIRSLERNREVLVQLIKDKRASAFAHRVGA